ncbi:unnamed protein product, partial [Musa banksii]
TQRTPFICSSKGLTDSRGVWMEIYPWRYLSISEEISLYFQLSLVLELSS